MDRAVKKLSKYGEAISAGVIVVGAVASFFTYTHITFLTRAEAEVRKQARDKFEETLVKDISRIDTNLNNLVYQGLKCGK